MDCMTTVIVWDSRILFQVDFQKSTVSDNPKHGLKERGLKWSKSSGEAHWLGVALK